MAVEVCLGRRFDHEHERRAFGRFLEEMLRRYQASDQLFIIVVELEANTAAIDLLILTQRALIVVDLKALTRVEECADEDIGLSGKENGPWEYAVANGGPWTMGGRDKNPYQQLHQMKWKLRDWLVDHPQHLPGGPWTRGDALNRIVTWVVISPGFDGDTSGLDLPWKRVRHWVLFNARVHPRGIGNPGARQDSAQRAFGRGQLLRPPGRSSP
jgi:hypothetical protein